MKKLFIKTLIGLLLFLSLAIAVLYLSLERVAATNMKDSMLAISRGVMSYYIDQLSNTPQSQWQHTLTKLQVGNRLTVNITPITKLPISAEQKNMLYQGKRVVYFGASGLFFNESVEAGYVCQRIHQSNSALVLEQGATPLMMMQDMTQWIRHAIYLKLSATDQSQWSFTLRQMQDQYGFPLALQLRKQQPDFIQKQLATYNIAFLPASQKWSNTKLISNWAVSKKVGYITSFFMPTPNKQWIVMAGPINYSYLNKDFSSLELILAYIFAIFIVVILTWLFSRNIHKIYQVTEHFRQGDFDFQAKLSRFSTLHDLYINITNTGKELKNRIETQHNMMRFVAHETRTPLTTMQLAYDQLCEYQNLPQPHKKHLDNIKEDINQLNELISDFLLYSQISTHELTLNKKQHDIIGWMKEILQPYCNIELCLPEGMSVLQVEFDQRLLKHATTNLLTNALKFAHHKIAISLEVEASDVLIMIDDDGPGISIDDRHSVFNAFTTLQANSDHTRHLGLGLNIAKHIVELHDGVITVVDSPLGGARFIVRICTNCHPGVAS